MSRGCWIPRTHDTKSLFCSSNVKETAKSRRDLPDNAIPNTEQILGIKFQERLRDVHTEISNWLVNDLNGVERRLEIHGDLHCLTADASSHQILNKKSSKNKCYCCLQMLQMHNPHICNSFSQPQILIQNYGWGENAYFLCPQEELDFCQISSVHKLFFYLLLQLFTLLSPLFWHYTSIIDHGLVRDQLKSEN